MSASRVIEPAVVRAPGGNSVESLVGRNELWGLAPELAHLDERLGVPVTAQARWAVSAFAATSDLEPWTLVSRGPDHRLRAAIVLSVRRRPEQIHVGIPRPRSDDRLSSRARSDLGVQEVADALAAALAATDIPWSVNLTGLSHDDPLVPALARRLLDARVEAGRPVPGLRLDRSRSDATGYLRDDCRRAIRRAHRRLAEEGMSTSTGLAQRTEAIVAALGTLEAAHRARDHDAGRRSDLDRRDAAAFWRRVIEDHATRRRVDLWTLRLGGQLAAYVVAFRDPPAYRVFDGRLVTRWARYAPGRMLEARMLDHVQQDPAFRHVDWMTSVAPEKLIAADHDQPSACVVAARDRSR